MSADLSGAEPDDSQRRSMAALTNAPLQRDRTDGDADQRRAIESAASASASTSALSLDGLEASSSGLRERTRSPYSSAAMPRREDVRSVAAGNEGGDDDSSPSQKGKERSTGNDDKDKEALFACHIWSVVPLLH